MHNRHEEGSHDPSDKLRSARQCEPVQFFSVSRLDPRLEQLLTVQSSDISYLGILNTIIQYTALPSLWFISALLTWNHRNVHVEELCPHTWQSTSPNRGHENFCGLCLHIDQQRGVGFPSRTDGSDL